jgi:Family of unknown function (DUF5995)
MSDHELASAKSTLDLSDRVASSFVTQLGALAPIMVLPFQAHFGRRPGFQMTVLDDKYWFAKLYALITYFEIRDHARFVYSSFVMHFITPFYKLYHDALQSYQRGDRGKVSRLWLSHFDGLRDGIHPTQPGSMDGAKHSIQTGVTAHVQGDMALALEAAYRSWKADPKPPFDALKKDFMENNRPVFEASKAAFFLDLNDKQPFPFRPEVGQLIIASGERAVGGGLSIDEVYQWREAAWKSAGLRLSHSATGDQH